MNPWRMAKTMQLLSVVHELTIQLEMQVKHHCWQSRPSEHAPEVQPIIPVPDHSAFPSGHATESFALASIINALRSAAGQVASPEDMEFRMAQRIAANRTVAGVHYPIDSAAGAVLGTAIAAAIAAAAQGRATYVRDFTDGAAFLDGNHDFTPGWYTDRATATPDAPVQIAAGLAPLLAQLWRAAVDEWCTHQPESEVQSTAEKGA